MDEETVKDTGWFPVDAEMVRVLKYTKEYETSIGPKYEEIKDKDVVNIEAKQHKKKQVRDLTLKNHKLVKNRKTQLHSAKWIIQFDTMEEMNIQKKRFFQDLIVISGICSSEMW